MQVGALAFCIRFSQLHGDITHLGSFLLEEVKGDVLSFASPYELIQSIAGGGNHTSLLSHTHAQCCELLQCVRQVLLGDCHTLFDRGDFLIHTFKFLTRFFLKIGHFLGLESNLFGQCRYTPDLLFLELYGQLLCSFEVPLGHAHAFHCDFLPGLQCGKLIAIPVQPSRHKLQGLTDNHHLLLNGFGLNALLP